MNLCDAVRITEFFVGNGIDGRVQILKKVVYLSLCSNVIGKA